MNTQDDNMLDAAVEKANREEILSTLTRWKDQLELMLRSGFSEKHACLIISNLMMNYMDNSENN